MNALIVSSLLFVGFYCVIIVFVDFVFRREAPGRVGASQYKERGGALHNVHTHY